MIKQAVKERRYEMDWIRVFVFDILILWHVGLYFVSWEALVDWDLPLKNNTQVSWLSWPMLFVRQWRLPILFVVSGMGTRFALSSRTGWQYIRERCMRLLVPLLAGILLLVPPVVYLERKTQGLFENSFWSFYPSFFKGFYPDGNFSWHHLWFLVYLFLMSVISLPLFLYLRKSGEIFFTSLKQGIRKTPLSLYIFAIPLIFVQVTLETRYPLTMALVDDWYAFSYYMLCFIWGFILASMGKQSWRSMQDIRYVSLILGLVLSLLILIMIHRGENPVWIRIIKPLNTWSWILAIFGYASKYLNRESALLRYRNTMVYPFYIIHFTILLYLGYGMRNYSMHYAWKIILMIAGTYGTSFILYEYFISKIRWIRPIFGLKRKA
jgi:hypothetical protein